jgi:hypothetical protein
LTGRTDVSRAHFVPEVVAEMSAHEVYHVGNLLIVQHRSEFWHCLLAVNDYRDWVASDLELRVTGQSRVHTSAYGAFAVRHVAVLAQPLKDRFAALFWEHPRSWKAPLRYRRRLRTNNQKDPDDAE